MANDGILLESGAVTPGSEALILLVLLTASNLALLSLPLRLAGSLRFELIVGAIDVVFVAAAIHALRHGIEPGLLWAAVGGALGMRYIQNLFWPSVESAPDRGSAVRLQGGLIAVAVLTALVFTFFPTEAFIDDSVETPFYIVPRADATP